eukprot:15332528-Ditylum_brightwellii.AAC.1
MLETIRLDDNVIGGQIPDNLEHLSSTMKRLIINNNTFSGTIRGVGDLTKLRSLELQNNNFIGSIPDSIGDARDIGKDGVN